MEIDEFLTRISLSGADPTIFTLYEKGENVTASGKKVYFDKRTLKTYTRTEDTVVIGLIEYEEPFPKQIFAMEPEGLKYILSESSNLKIEENSLVATGNIDCRWKLEVLGKSKTLELKYDQPDIPLTKELIARIIRADSVLDATTVRMSSTGQEVIIELSGKMKSNLAKVRMPFKGEKFESIYQKRYIECLKLAANNDVLLNVDGYKPEARRDTRGAGRILLKDDNSSIAYYVTEVTRSINDEKRAAKVSVPKDVKTLEEHSEAIPDVNGDDMEADQGFVDTGDNDV